MMESRVSRKLVWLGLTCLALGTGWIIADQILNHLYPEKWAGDANIGGGFLLLVAFSLILLGLVLLLVQSLRPTVSRGSHLNSSGEGSFPGSVDSGESGRSGRESGL